MKSFKIVDGDLQLDGQNNLRMVDGDDEFMQCITETLKTNAGEWFLNPLHGFDRFEILGEKYDQERAINALFAALMQEPRVDRVENIELEFDRANRRLSVKYAVIKTTGETVEGGVVV